LVDLKVVDNALVLAAASQAGIVGFNVEGARVHHNDVAGVGYAGVVAKDSAHWRIHDNNFCGLLVRWVRTRKANRGQQRTPAVAVGPQESQVAGPMSP
jgi:nitrous oxidase accessory protein NosD